MDSEYTDTAEKILKNEDVKAINKHYICQTSNCKITALSRFQRTMNKKLMSLCSGFQDGDEKNSLHDKKIVLY